MFGQYDRTCSANMTEHVRSYWPNMLGPYCGICSANLARLVRFGRNFCHSVVHYTKHVWSITKPILLLCWPWPTLTAPVTVAATGVTSLPRDHPRCNLYRLSLHCNLYRRSSLPMPQQSPVGNVGHVLISTLTASVTVAGSGGMVSGEGGNTCQTRWPSRVKTRFFPHKKLKSWKKNFKSLVS